MIIQSITPTIDVIIPNEQPDIDSMTNDQLIDFNRTEEMLYHYELLKRRNRRLKEQNRRKPMYIIKQLLTTMI